MVAARPESGNAHDQLGKLLFKGGMLGEAVTQLEAAVSAVPQSDYIHYQLQEAYRKQSPTADADRELQVYKELKAPSREATVPRRMERP